jgi:hypothetical protein
MEIEVQITVRSEVGQPEVVPINTAGLKKRGGYFCESGLISHGAHGSHRTAEPQWAGACSFAKFLNPLPLCGLCVSVVNPLRVFPPPPAFPCFFLVCWLSCVVVGRKDNV